MIINNSSKDKLIPLRDSLLEEVETNEDWALLNNSGALPPNLEYHSMQFEKTNDSITVDEEEGVVFIYIKHKVVGGDIEVGKVVRFALGDELPADKTLWADGQEDDLYEDAWRESGYAEQQELIAKVERLIKIKDAIS
jgi:hypothetical protein